jgi:hypothetical protein
MLEGRGGTAARLGSRSEAATRNNAMGRSANYNVV